MDLLNHAWKHLHDSLWWKTGDPEIRRINRDHFGALRTQLAQARPFNVDNRAMKMAYELSLEAPRKIAKRLMLARLPFPKTWIEIDFRAKVAIASAMGHSMPASDETPSRIGWLLQEAPGDPHVWYSTTFSIDPTRQPGNEVGFSLVSFMVDTLNRAPPSTVGPVSALSRDFLRGVVSSGTVGLQGGAGEDQLADGFRHIGWGYTGSDIDGKLSMVEQQRHIAVAEDLDNSINIGLTPLARALLPFKQAVPMKQVIVENAVELRGDVRMIVALLSLINEVPIIIERQPRQSGKVRMGGNLKPYLQTTKVIINLPTKRYKTIVRGLLKNAAAQAKARHEVRGHWRTIVHKRTHERQTKLPDGTIETQLIHKGELEKVWVSPHERGDARLGYVRHTYDVEKRAGY